MSKYKNLFHLDLVHLGIDGRTENEIFEKVYVILKSRGYVTEDYLEGIKKREEEFPTGLITKFLNIALPHSEPEFVNKAFVCIVRLEKNVIVRQMGDNQEIQVKDLFFLGIKDGRSQAGLLSQFVNLFMDEEFVIQYSSMSEEASIYELFKNNI